MTTELLIERISRPHALSDYINPKPVSKPKPIKQNDTTAKALFERIQKRAWLEETHIELIVLLKKLRQQVFFIPHLKKCKLCQAELTIDVERYLGSKTLWWVSLEGNEYFEEMFPDAPKVENYHIGNYWEQLMHYRKYGNTDTGDNTLEFIFARADWAYKIYGKQIHIVRQMLRLIKRWDFTRAIEQEYNKLYCRLNYDFLEVDTQ